MRAFTRSLDYLKTIGPGKFLRLISGVDTRKLLAISEKVDHARVIHVLKSTDLERSIFVLKHASIEKLIPILQELSESDLVVLMNHMQPEHLVEWSAKIDAKVTLSLVGKIGAAKAVDLITSVGIQKSMQLAKALTAKQILESLENVPLPDLRDLTRELTLQEITRFIKKRGSADLPAAIHFLGTDNLILLLRQNGVDKTLKLFQIFTFSEILQLTRIINGLKLPKRTSKDWTSFLADTSQSGQVKPVKPTAGKQKTDGRTSKSQNKKNFSRSKNS